MISLFDAHCDTAQKMLESGEGLKSGKLQVNLEQAEKYRQYAQFFALFDESGTKLDFLQKKIMAEIDKNSTDVVLCTTKSGAESAFAEKKAAAFLSIEGAHMFGCDINRFMAAYKAGVRAVGITWNNANVYSGAALDEPERGLSAEGRDFVLLCGKLGIIVDVSHISDAGFWDICAVSDAPFMASHSNSRSVCANPRNLTDEMFREIARHGGVAGINLYADFTGGSGKIEDLTRHIARFLELDGAKNIAIGADFDGCPKLCEPIRSAADLELLYERLIKLGLKEDTVQDIFFGNMMRLVGMVCGT